MPSVEARLRRLEAIEAARGLLADYARACDAQDVDALAGLFATECELEIPGRSWHGVDGVRDFYEDAFRQDPSRKSHFITNVKAGEIRPGVVAVDAYFLFTAAGDMTSVLGWGEYADLVDTNGSEPVFQKKGMRITRATDVRTGWALEPVPADGPAGPR